MWLTVLYGQDTSSKVRFVVNPPDAIIRFDGQKMPDDTLINASPGQHRIQTWAPKMVYVDTTVNLQKDSFYVYRQYLQKTQAYLDFKQDYDSIHRKRIDNILIKSSLAVWNTGLTLVLVFVAPKGIDRYSHEVETYAQDYARALTQADLDNYRQQYNHSKDLYNQTVKRRNTYLAVAIPALAASYGLSIFAWIKLKKAPKLPQYSETPLLSRMDIKAHFNWYQPANSQISFTYKF